MSSLLVRALQFLNKTKFQVGSSCQLICDIDNHQIFYNKVKMLLKYHNIVTKISEYHQYIGGKCEIEPKKSSD